MSKCKYLIDISPYDPLCDHPCRLYGGGAVEAECETCQYRIEDLERENAKLRELVRDLYSCGDSCTHCRHWNQGDGFYCNLGVGWKAKRMRELGVGVDE